MIVFLMLSCTSRKPKHILGRKLFILSQSNNLFDAFWGTSHTKWTVYCVDYPFLSDLIGILFVGIFLLVLELSHQNWLTYIQWMAVAGMH